MADSKYERLPQAGDFEKKSGVEVVYFSPKPLPMGGSAFSDKKLQGDANNTYIDFSISKDSFEFGVRCYIGSVIFIMLFFSMANGIMASASISLANRFFWSDFLRYSLNPYMWGVVAFMIALYCFAIFRVIRLMGTHPPTRFNRERREVAFVLKKGDAPRFVPWENVIACASASQNITQYGATNSFALMLGLRDAESGDVLWVTAPHGSLSLAVAEWEAIRVYMEEGLSALPVLTESDEMFEEGTVPFFYFCRKTYRENHSWLAYFFGFVLLQFFSGWTLPCYISNWISNRPKAAYPKSVIEWSKPLPPEQHAKPSAELLEQSAQARKAYAEGKTFLQHFGIDEVDEDFV